LSRYKRCPSDKILVIYGKTNSGSAKCLAGGATFVWPVVQDYAYLDLHPISIDVDLHGALSRQNIRVNVPSRFTVAISTEPGVMTNAAERLLNRNEDEIRDMSKDIIFGQLRLVVATMDIEEINADRDKFLANVYHNVGTELRKIGLELINVNVTDIQDESGYIEALGKEAAAQAINEAKVRVAQHDQTGSIGQAEARQLQRVKVSEAEAGAASGEADAARLQRVRIAEADAVATEGENLSRIKIAQSDAVRREQEAEALRRATAAEKVQNANSLADAYEAERKAELARAARERATLEANEIVKADIAKRQAEINAEAEAEKIRRTAKGEADALLSMKQAEAQGNLEILAKQAEGLKAIVDAAGGDAREAVLMLIADKLPELVKTQVEAIKGIKIDKVTVWEGGGSGGSNGEGVGSTANFVSGLYKAVPPLRDLFDMAGMSLPSYLGAVEDVEGEVVSNGKKKPSKSKSKPSPAANGKSDVTPPPLA
jgi:flotillin